MGGQPQLKTEFGLLISSVPLCTACPQMAFSWLAILRVCCAYLNTVQKQAYGLKCKQNTRAADLGVKAGVHTATKADHICHTPAWFQHWHHLSRMMQTECHCGTQDTSHMMMQAPVHRACHLSKQTFNNSAACTRAPASVGSHHYTCKQATS
jgi:hypothetical protein